MSFGSFRPPAEPDQVRATKATVFVSDPSVEAERIAQALRTSGYAVVDVPLSMLVARVAVQRPHVIVVDADADGAHETVARMREIPEADTIDVVFIGRTAAAFSWGDDLDDDVLEAKAASYASGSFFTRPVDITALMQKVEVLNEKASLSGTRDLGSPGRIESIPPPLHRSVRPPPLGLPAIPGDDWDVEAGGARMRSSLPPKASVPPAPRPSSSRPSVPPPRASQPPPPPSNRAAAAAVLPPPSIRAGVDRQSQPPPPASLPSLAQLTSHAPAAMGPGTFARRAISVQGNLSGELAQLLAEAEERVVAEHIAPDSTPPSPEEEIEAVLPEEILAALDEPLEANDDDDDLGEGPDGAQVRRTTSGGSNKQTTGAAALRGTTGAGTAIGTHAGAGTAIGTNVGAPIAPPPVQQPVPSAAAPLTTAEPLRSARLEAPPETRGEVQEPTLGGTRPGASRHSAPPPTFDPFNLASNAAWSRARANDGGDVAPLAEPVDDGRQTSPPAPQPTTGAHTPVPPAVQDVGTSLKAETVAPVEPIPTVLGPDEAPMALSRAIAARLTGTLCYESKDGVRRVVLREGDIVTCASGVDDEGLMAYLVARGDLPRERMNQLAGRFATFGRHAGAALVAQGYLRQDQLWPVLRGHAEWILGRAMLLKDGTAIIEPEPPGRLRGEPSVFGGSTGAEVLVEVLRRVIAPDDAIRRMDGPRSRIAEGPHPQLQTECALGQPEVAILEQARGRTIEEALEGEADTDMASVLYALSLLGVIVLLKSIDGRREEGLSAAEVDALDADAIRERVRTRLSLVHEGDYFAILGVPRSATGYEVRRAFLELRRAFEPSRLLTPQIADLNTDVRKIVAVLEEAYEILRDGARRERYRRAINAIPQS
jgi:hypothetical protein